MQAAKGIPMRPQLIIDNDPQQSTTINIMRAITAPTLLEQLPLEILVLLSKLGEFPASTPTLPTIGSLRVVV